MVDPPPRAFFAVLHDVASAIARPRAIGYARCVDDGRVSVFNSHAHGITGYALPTPDLPDVLMPGGSEVRYLAHAAMSAAADRALEWQLLTMGARVVISAAMPAGALPRRVWVAFSEDVVSTATVDAVMAGVAERAAEILDTPESAEQSIERLRRLERAAALLPALLHAHDLSVLFDVLSSIGPTALQHDMVTFGLFSDDLATITMYERQAGERSSVATVLPPPYPASIARSFEFDLIDDRAEYPLFERDQSPTREGMHSTLRLPFTFGGRLIGGIAFHTRAHARFDVLDLAVARRLADYVAIALFHLKTAEEARRAEKLRARTTQIELLDELLAALVDSGDIPDVFGRISSIAAKVLPHDAAVLMVRLPDGVHARLYASSGISLPQPGPTVTEVPKELLANPDWEFHILDLPTAVGHPAYQQLMTMGFVSLLRVPIRLEGRFEGALLFLSTSTSAFTEADVLVARRMADRMAVTLTRDRVIEASKRAAEASARASQLEARVRALTEELDARTGYRRVVGESKEWRQVLRQATQVAATDTTVLLLGESGTGKEVVARFLHRGSSRSAGPFIALNCAALPEQLLEAELFGYERGAYTGATHSKPGQLEQAAGGTLFLDEVAEMSPSAQAKFLRVLQEREFQRLGGTRVLRTDARVVAATNRDLQRAIANGQFREDLYYRLNVFAIKLPSLRQRPDDVLPLSESFLAEIGRGLGRPPGGISRDARQMLVDYHWPGNVRELRNVLERAAILCDGGLITPEHLAVTIAPPVASAASRPAARETVAVATQVPAAVSSAADLASMERAMIEQALQNAKFNKSKAAKALGLTRHQLYIRMRKHGFET